VGAAEATKLYCILSPVGPYFPSGFAPVKLLTDTSAVRAWPGGTGGNKVGGNYAVTIEPSQRAIKKGFSQILWLFGPNLDVTEVGTMNQFFYLKSRDGEPQLLTAPLDGTILPGITRDSIIHLARGWGIKVVERTYNLHEMMDAIKEGRMLEAFGAGTAAIVCPVESFRYGEQDYVIPLDRDDPTQKAGPLTRKLLSTITDIQYGKVKHEWSQVI
jgi:branched-chain amino acid aminotransferase